MNQRSLGFIYPFLSLEKKINKKNKCNHTASPVDFAGLVPAPVLSIWSGVSVLPLEEKTKKNKRQTGRRKCQWG